MNDSDPRLNILYGSGIKQNREHQRSVNCQRNENYFDKECQMIWERKSTNDLVDFNNESVSDCQNVPIMLEKPKSCTCHLQQYSTRHIEINIPQLNPTTSKKQSAYNLGKNYSNNQGQSSPVSVKSRNYFNECHNDHSPQKCNACATKSFTVNNFSNGPLEPVNFFFYFANLGFRFYYSCN